MQPTHTYKNEHSFVSVTVSNIRISSPRQFFLARSLLSDLTKGTRIKFRPARGPASTQSPTRKKKNLGRVNIHQSFLWQNEIKTRRSGIKTRPSRPREAQHNKTRIEQCREPFNAILERVACVLGSVPFTFLLAGCCHSASSSSISGS